MKTPLKQFVDEYRLTRNGVSFWAPYPYKELKLAQRREYASGPPPPPPPFKGRGTPAEIGQRLSEELERAGAIPATPQEYRAFMAERNLGVDCSGFAYYVLDNYLGVNMQTELKHHLFKARSQLLEIYDHPKLTPPPELKRAQVVAYPEWVSLAQIESDWGNEPRNVVDSTIFTNTGSTVAVAMDELAPADLVALMGYDGIGHHLVVTEVKSDCVVYAHSAGRHGRSHHYGGVEYGQIKLTAPGQPLERQEWQDDTILGNHRLLPAPLRRLRALREQSN